VSGLSFLIADYNVVCWYRTHLIWTMTLGLFMTFAFAIGVPVAFFYILYYHQKNVTKYRPVYGFISYGFHEEYYYWEVVIIARKFCFSVVSVLLISVGGMIQGLIGLGVLVTFLQAQNSYRPYESPKMNFAEEFGLLTRITTLLFGLGIGTQTVTYDAIYAFGTMIVIINAVFILYCLYHIFWAVRVIQDRGLLAAMGLNSSKRNGSWKLSDEQLASKRTLSNSVYESKHSVSRVEDVYRDSDVMAENPVFEREFSDNAKLAFAVHPHERQYE
jgi:hypothetical protein